MTWSWIYEAGLAGTLRYNVAVLRTDSHTAGPMEITQRVVGEVTVLDLAGRMTRNDGYGAVKARVTELLGQSVGSFVLNLTDVPYLDSTCVGELVSAFITVRNKGGKLKLFGATGRIRKLLTVAKLDTVFEVFESEAAAVASFVRPTP